MSSAPLDGVLRVADAAVSALIPGTATAHTSHARSDAGGGRRGHDDDDDEDAHQSVFFFCFCSVN